MTPLFASSPQEERRNSQFYLFIFFFFLPFGTCAKGEAGGNLDVVVRERKKHPRQRTLKKKKMAMNSWTNVVLIR
jgi:hypothetical protein